MLLLLFYSVLYVCVISLEFVQLCDGAPSLQQEQHDKNVRAFVRKDLEYLGRYTTAHNSHLTGRVP